MQEGVAHPLGPGREHRLGGDREGQPNDDHAGQVLTGHVDPFPEAGGAQQERVLALLERPQQVAALAVDALSQDENVVQVAAVLEPGVDVAELLV